MKKGETKMKKILVYSHDTFGLGNIRRMLAIVQKITESIEDVSILVVSGSSMMQAFRLSPGIDYIKLPCLARNATGAYAPKTLGISYRQLINLRADLIVNAFLNFEPDMVLVDKKPLGVQNELAPALEVLRRRANRPKLVLLLRDIMDDTKKTAEIWQKNDYHQIIAELYDRVLILGSRKVFDTVAEYEFPTSSRQKSHFCGYIAKQRPRRSVAQIRESLNSGSRKILLVTAGGGEDGQTIFHAALDAIERYQLNNTYSCLFFLGPEMQHTDRGSICNRIQSIPNVMQKNFSGDFISYLEAADMVVSMGGYNTLTELMAVNTPAVVIPRIEPCIEQWMRAKRFHQLGLIEVIHPRLLDPERLVKAIKRAESKLINPARYEFRRDLTGSTVVVEHVRMMLEEHFARGWTQIDFSGYDRTRVDSTLTVEDSYVDLPSIRHLQ